ncbi:MAG: mechanosensitive ion channel family protein [Roseobacter sp.]|jgi:small conductance mechanosensitive channel|nr:mechanosensitive ion channel family protein [Roseobacter sp.]
MQTSNKLQSRLGKTLRLLLGFLAMVIVLSAGAVWAQNSDPEQPEATSNASAEAISNEPAADAASADDSSPAYPAGLDDPAIDLAELTMRLIPLTVKQLGPLADAWQNIVAEQTQAVVDETLRVSRLPEDQKEAGREQVVELTERRDEGFDRFTAVVSNLAKKGGDEAAIETYRAYRASIIVQEKQQADWQTLLKEATNWVVARDGGIQLGLRILVIGGALLGLLIVARITRAYARRMFRHVPNISKLLQGFLAMVVYWITIAVGLMIVMSALGVDITPLFAVFGGGAFILAFAMQETLGNLAAGLMIMINRPFDEGDYVSIAGLGGTVKHVSIVSTEIITPDNQVIVIPNSKVWGDVITNVTASDTRRVDMIFGIGYDDSIEKAQSVLEEVVGAHPLVLQDPAPVVRVNELADSAVNFIVRPWTKTADYWTVYWDLHRAVKEAFDARGISIPFPQTDMHVYVAGGATPAAMPALSSKQDIRSNETSGIASGDDCPGTPDRDENEPN